VTAPPSTDRGRRIRAFIATKEHRRFTEFADAVVQPGDTIFVPEQVNKSTFVQDAKDWTQILYQFGLGLAGIKTLGL